MKLMSMQGKLFRGFWLCVISLLIQQSSLMARVHNGILFLNNQAIIDSQGDLTEVTGGVMISGGGVANLDSLRNLVTIGSDLIVMNCDNLLGLDGLSSLQTITGALFIQENDNLVDINGLASLQTVRQLEIHTNPALQHISGIAQLNAVELTASIRLNSGLTSISGFSGLVSVGSLEIKDNNALLNINGFDALQTITNHCTIENNPFLGGINGFDALQSVGMTLTLSGNPKLAALTGFNGLTAISGDFLIENNAKLVSTAGFFSLSSVNGSFSIKDNPALEAITGFDVLQSVGAFLIHTNAALKVLDGFDGLVAVGAFEILDSTLLTRINGFGSLKVIDGPLLIQGCSELEFVSAFLLLETITGDFAITDNARLYMLDGFSTLQNILGQMILANNPALTTLTAFSNFKLTNRISIIDNILLDQFCGLLNVVAHGPDGMVWDVRGNADNPSREEVLIACSRRITAGVFYDKNSDGAWGEIEPGIADVIIMVDAGREVKNFKSITGLDGRCRFRTPPPGHVYDVFIKENTLPPGFSFTTADMVQIENTIGSNIEDIFFGLSYLDSTIVEEFNDDAGSDSPLALVFVDGSPGFVKEPWSNLVDGDKDGWDGTATVKADSTGKIWGLFGFGNDQSAMIDILSIIGDNGSDDDLYPDRHVGSVEIFVSNSGIEEVDFTSLGVMHLSQDGDAKLCLSAPLQAKYIKIVILGDYGAAWKQLVELSLGCAGRDGAVPAAKNFSVAELPSNYSFEQNYPNPFNPTTTIRYSIPELQNVDIAVYNINGDLVKQLVKGEQPAGAFNALWDSTDENGERVASGVYFYRIVAGVFYQTNKMTLLQ
jgi:hypothetical protein